MSSEPSMEEILSSIKRIIAEEGDGLPGRQRRGSRAAPVPPTFGDDDEDEEVLELSDPIADGHSADSHSADGHSADGKTTDAPSPDVDVSTPPPPIVSPRMREQAMAPPKPASTPSSVAPELSGDEPAVEPIVSPRTAEASRGSLDALSRMVVKPEANSDNTLEGLVREMLRPMLRDWLDATLPGMVETMVAREIARITEQR